MYRLLDPRTCPATIRLVPGVPSAFLDTEDVAMAAVAENGTLVYFNRAFLRQFGLTYAAARLGNIEDTFPDHRHQFPEQTGGAGSSGRRLLELRSGNSGPVVGRLLVSFTSAPKDRPAPGLRDLVRDLDRPNPLFDDAYCGLYVADPQAYTLRVNPAYERIAFLPENDLVGRSLQELEDKGYFSQSVTLRVLERLMRKQRESVTLFQKIVTGKQVLVTGQPICSDTGQLDCILTFVRDLIPVATLVRKCETAAHSRDRVWAGTNQVRATSRQQTEAAAEPIFPRLDRLPIVVRDPLFQATMQQAVRAATVQAPILLTGETGVGKDLIAKYVLLLSSQSKEKPFVSVNCSAIPKELLESELFGYEEGAFSGARKGGKVGLFEQAHQGILFLNEISEMPLELQTKLLTVLDEGSIRRLGGTRTKQVQVRLICATNGDLRRKVAEGSFRSDFYYRIKVLSIHIPPLRERPKDILPLVQYFTGKVAHRYGLRKHFSPAAQEALLAYEWPGNVRELHNLIERLVVFSCTPQISVGELPEEILQDSVPQPQQDPIRPPPDRPLKQLVKQYERHLIEAALARHGKIATAARALGIDPTTLSRKLRN